MIFEGTPLKMSLQFLVLCIIFCFQSPVFNALPFMYYRADLSCKIDGNWQPCEEQLICDNHYEFEFVNKNNIESITMDYGLICDLRLKEASILSIGFFGQLAAYLIAIFTEIPRCNKTAILFALIATQGLLNNSLAYIKGSLEWVTFVIFAWNLIYSYLYSQIFAYANDMYTTAIKDKAVNLINIMWTGGALLFVAYSWSHGNWINHVAYFGGLTEWILGILFFLLRSPPLPEIDGLHQPVIADKEHSGNSEKDAKEEAKQQQKNFIKDLLDKCILLKNNRKYLKNALIYIFCWSVFQTSYSTPFIAFNNLGGDLKHNVFISIFFDFIGSFVAFFLLSRLDSLRLLLNNILIIGSLQTFSYFVPTDCFALQLFIILGTKLSTRMAFPTLLTLLAYVLPYQFNQLVFNVANVISIVFSTLLPFYRYYMEVNNINIFFGIGVISLILLPFATCFRTLEDENADIKAARASRDFKKKSSFAPMRRTSDAIIETMLGKSSMIAQQAALMIIDKQSVAEEKRFIQNQKQLNELQQVSS